MDKEKELKRSKRNALLLLLAAAAVFLITLFLPRNLWVDGIKAVSEAAMVGALADWFAVVALFRRVPLPLIGAHTAVIPRNKNKIADNLALFVQEKFLDANSLVGLIRKYDPATMLADWLNNPANTERMARYLVRVLRGLFEMTDDVRIQRFLKKALFTLIDKIDLTASVSTLLESMTKEGRHQELLDSAVTQLIRTLQQPTTRATLSRQIVRWVKREHPIKEKILPTSWLGEHGADMIADAVGTILDEISADRGHALRVRFDMAVESFIERLKHDPSMALKAEEIKSYLKHDETLNTYVKALWGDLREWMRNDLDKPDSLLQQKMRDAGRWLGETLAQDATLRGTLNRQLEQAAGRMAPDFAAFLTQHISDTVKSWDEAEMSHQIELNIGKDLQFIRINGTLVGASIGLLLYLFSLLPLVVPRLLQ
ncbi:DUF445 domain-containing protein [Chimaeribacter californicus]|uniref:DUF445 domain-containing protein n=1 Tax=Chimaeribacter californicus TaxID=2060067 RepID=A0A2N5EDN3_9GAMM|nr:DUF445 family protein [Chimaeribacter californicus]PLR40622.1 DUF445 domain-containing protein [Chimaeribacter californicus]